MLLWPPSANSYNFTPEDCRQDMFLIYKVLSLEYDPRGYETDWLIKVDKYLAEFKAKCGPLEAHSVADLENGNFLRKLRAHVEKVEKASSHLDDYGNAIKRTGCRLCQWRY
jgi:hypothetical protein